jgi:EpsI family protein
MNWIRSKYVAWLTLALLVQSALFYAAARGEKVPAGRPLDLFPAQLGGWSEVQNYPVEQEIRDQLKADDLLNRLYADPQSRAGVSLFVAYFKTQRTGQSPHSPKNCLPGAGWEPEASGLLDVAVAGQPQPVRINRFVVSHGGDKSVVLYWYQSQRRVVASEFSAKFWAVMDSIRYHRSDTALVRLTIPVANNDPDTATRIGVAFVQTAFPALKAYLPG